TSMTRLGTGLRINSAMDDAAGLQIATRLDAQSRGMQVAMKNAQNGISMLQTAEGALNEVSNILLRMKDLA
ncbi:flagellin N-terminal helical domain-containing protein, partial [Chromobacterium haemolyticum]|uniref:flagellin N-terminal helical domain-containing protein n=2 Tax=Chromobacteriaceae TaxID=1499392 RepID=UPI004057B2E3